MSEDYNENFGDCGNRLKTLVYVSGGQDGLYCLYKTLTDTNDSVLAINLQEINNYTKEKTASDLEHCIKNIEWLKNNVRDFEFKNRPELTFKWYRRIPFKERDWSELDLHVKNLIINASEFIEHRLPEAHRSHILYHVEKEITYLETAKLENVDKIVYGLTYLQKQNSRFNLVVNDIRKYYGYTYSEPIVEEKLGRFMVYTRLPEQVRLNLFPCEDTISKNCGECEKCITRIIYNNFIKTGITTAEEIDRSTAYYIQTHPEYTLTSVEKLTKKYLYDRFIYKKTI
jgi:hypothetical protein